MPRFHAGSGDCGERLRQGRPRSDPGLDSTTLRNVRYRWIRPERYRQSLRRFFEVDRTSIALAALVHLADEGIISNPVVSGFIAKARLRSGRKLPPWEDGWHDH